ncbi:MAG: rRNA pseudouridine synthase [Oscillospiraceae bacterium]|nr:rRNA pseudouridine synthase [Oscillospiraceae bacterium]
MQQKCERLQKILSAYGIASRRDAEVIISSGRVRVNGKIATLGESANACTDVIEVDGKPLAQKSEPVYIMLSKPVGYLTTASDDRGRKTVMELLSDVGTRVYPVGRLDLNSEGLLLLTNDGDFANTVSHPSNGKLKVYEVGVRGDIAKAIELLQKPVIIPENDDTTTAVVKAESVKLISKTASGGYIEIAIKDGRNRQVRKMCTVCGLHVINLKRKRIGDVELGDLEIGKWRHLTASEVKSLG